jgi:hypothetical protein
LLVTNNIELKYFQQLNNNIVKYIYNNDKPRLIAVDGTYIVLKKSINTDTDGYKLTKRVVSVKH